MERFLKAPPTSSQYSSQVSKSTAARRSGVQLKTGVYKISIVSIREGKSEQVSFHIQVNIYGIRKVFSPENQ